MKAGRVAARTGLNFVPVEVIMAHRETLGKWVGTKEIPKADPEDMVFAFEAFCAAASGQMPDVNPSERGFVIDGQEYSFVDGPVNRGMMAATDALDHLSQDASMAAMFRLMEIQGLSPGQKNRLSEWMYRDGDSMMISHSLVRAAAVADFNSKGRLKVGSLIAAARQFDEEGD